MVERGPRSPRPHPSGAAGAASAATLGGRRCNARRAARRIRAWLDRLPENLEGSPRAEKLQAITEIDLDELLAIAFGKADDDL
jgi:hypothetical protein